MCANSRTLRCIFVTRMATGGFFPPRNAGSRLCENSFGVVGTKDNFSINSTNLMAGIHRRWKKLSTHCWTKTVHKDPLPRRSWRCHFSPHNAKSWRNEFGTSVRAREGCENPPRLPASRWCQLWQQSQAKFTSGEAENWLHKSWKSSRKLEERYR